MKKFIFSLESLLNIRNRKVEDIKLRLSEKNSEIAKLHTEMLSLESELKKMQLEQVGTRSGNIDINSLRHSVNFRNDIKLRMLSKGNELRNKDEELFNIKRELVIAEQQRKALEIIKDKRYAQWKKNYQKEEQNKIDDISQQKYIMTQRESHFD